VKQIQTALQIITGGLPFEVRAPKVENDRGYSQPWFGYFDDVAAAAKAVHSLDKQPGCGAVYVTLNPVLPDLLARCYNRLAAAKKDSSTTTDAQITGRRWMLIDVDPVRPAGVSSNDSEHQLSLDIAGAVKLQLDEWGWPEPLEADSGNGAHLLYRLDLPNDEPSKTLVHDSLKALASLFDIPGQVQVDQGVANASRISKIYGTMARKGDHIPARPHRRARIINAPADIRPVPLELLEALAAKAPKPVAPAPRTPPAPRSQSRGNDILERARKYMESVPAPVTGQNSNDALYKAGCKLVRDFELGEHDAVEILHEWASQTEAWDRAPIEKVIRNAQKHARGEPGRLANAERPSMHAPALKQEDEGEPLDWGDIEEGSASSKGKPVPTEGEDPRELYNKAKATDMGNAERLVKLAGSRLRHVPQWGWLAWDGKRWAIDEGKAREEYKRVVVPGIYQEVLEAARAQDMEMVRIKSKWGLRSEEAGRIGAALHVAKSDAALERSHLEFDQKPWLFNCQNGTIDLRTGALLPHRQEDMITRVSPVVYDPAAECPMWEEFLLTSMGGNGALCDYIQRAVGYSMTGGTEEQVMFLAVGNGQNGKSVLMNTMKAIYGDYAAETPAETLVVRKNENNNSNDLARLAGVRLVTANETEEGQRLAEARVKGMTGGDTLTARFLHKEFFEFKPQFKLWLRTNHRPVIRGSDKGIWRRLRMVPFEVVIPDAQKIQGLEDLLKAEHQGILAWAVRGCLEWQRGGLRPPKEVLVAESQYKEHEDILGAFLRERCVVNQYGSGFTFMKEIYKEYTEWCEEAGERAQTQRKVGQALSERGFKARKGAGGLYVVDGIRIVTCADGDTEDKSEQKANDVNVFGEQTANKSGVSGVGGAVSRFSKNLFFTRKENLETTPLTPLTPLRNDYENDEEVLQ